MRLLLLLALCGCPSTAETGACADPGDYSIVCTAGGATVDRNDGTCPDFADHGEQLVSSMESACVQDDPDCTCTVDVSACTFPCGTND